MSRDGSLPERLGRYDVLRRLGAGGMAEVYLARSRGAEGTHKLVVLKRVLPNQSQSSRMRQMFIDEARLSMRLNHPNIVQVFDFQDTPEGFLLCMEYVEGLDLGRLMSSARSKGARIPAWVGAYVIMESARGLHCAHERKGEDGSLLEIVHRDVSPQNVLLSFEGGVKVADFGIASAKTLVEEAGVLKGKFAYMSPEQARGEKVDRRTDVYALGVCLHEILTGRLLFTGMAGDELLSQVRKGDIEAPSLWASEVPPELDAICVRALARLPEDRFATARDMAGAIARALQRQEDVIDAAAVEATISQFSPREITSPGDLSEKPGSVDLSGSIAAFAQVEAELRPSEFPPSEASHSEVGSPPLVNESVEDAPKTMVAAPAAKRDSRKSLVPRQPYRSQRELRHVALVHLRLHGLEELAMDLGPGAAFTARESAQRVLDGIAWKRGGRWTWDDDEPTARAVLGLTVNASSAPFEAAALALDVHDALADLSQDLPIAIAASASIVRAVASGERDESGHLLHHHLQPPAQQLADALCAAAPATKTWVAGGLYRLVRREFQWGDAPTLELDGKESTEQRLTRTTTTKNRGDLEGGSGPEAVQKRGEDGPRDGLPSSLRAYALARALTREERLAELAQAPGELAGRDVERADLQAAYHRAVATPEVVSRLVVGEMGIGKTALVATFLRELPPDARALRMECAPSHMEVPYAAIGELVRDACLLDGTESAGAARAAIANVLGPFLQGPTAEPALDRLAEVATGHQADGAGEDDAGFRKKLLVSGVRRLLASVAMRGPVVVVAEGTQWSDKQSLDLLAELLKGTQPLPVLVILVARGDDRIAQALSGIVKVELRRLTFDEQQRLLEQRLGVRAGVAQFTDVIASRAGGNPFFLLEILDALLERGAISIEERPDGQNQLVQQLQAGDFPLPSTLEQLLAERLHELPPDEKEISQWAAVAGGPIDISVLGSLVAPELVLDDVLGRLCARGICDRKGDTIDLRHPVARDVAYISIEPMARAVMHRRLGERLATTPLARGLSAAIVARHLVRGEALEASAPLYLEAANAARAGYQTALSIRYYLRALTGFKKQDVQRFFANEALESIYRMTGRRRERRLQLEEMRGLARELKSPRLVTLALLRSARLDLDEGHLARGLPLAQKAVATAEATRQSALVVEAHALIVEFLRELGDVEGALRAANQALSISEQPGVPLRLKADVLRAKGILLRRLGRTHEAVRVYADSVALLRAVGAKRSEARTKNALAYAMFVLARYEDAIALAKSSVALDLSIGGRFQIAKTLTNIGQCYARLGDLPRALVYLKRSRDAHERYGDQDGRTDTLLVTSEILIQAGDLDGASTFVGDARALVAVTGSAYDATHEMVVRASLHRARGETRLAADVAAAARPLAQTRGLASFHLLATAIEAEARAALGELAHGSMLAHSVMGLVESTEGSEFGLEVRTLAAKALELSRDGSAQEAFDRARDYCQKVFDRIADARIRGLFLARPEVARYLSHTSLRPQEPSVSAEPQAGVLL